jgi:exosome complex exonuclease RRP6
MQLSTRAEDFVVDALALRSHIGPVLGPIFADPGVRAVAGRRA